MKFIANLNYPLILIIGFICKIAVIAPTYQDSIVCIVLAAIYATREYFIARKEVISENTFRKQVNDDIQLIKNNVSGLNLKVEGNPFGGIRR